MKRLQIIGAGCLMIGSAITFLISLGAFAGHPGTQFMWVLTKWEGLFGQDPSTPINVIAATFFVSLAQLLGGVAIAMHVWFAHREH